MLNQPTVKRFVDEGADFRNYTYAQYGARRATAARRSGLAGFRRRTGAKLLYDDYFAGVGHPLAGLQVWPN